MAEPENKKKKRLGEILREAGLITEDQLLEALETQQRSGERIGKILVKLGMIEEDKMMDYLGEQLGIPPINLSPLEDLGLLQEFTHLCRCVNSAKPFPLVRWRHRGVRSSPFSVSTVPGSMASAMIVARAGEPG